MNIRPWDENTWFSPLFVIDQLSVITQEGDTRKIKKIREAWVSAISMICFASFKPAEWWLQIPRHDPPDVFAMKLVPSPMGLGQDMVDIKIEVFEIVDFVKEPIKQSIKRKLGNKDYSGMTLIGFVRKDIFFDHIELSEYILSLKPKVFCILLLVCENQFPVYSLIQLYPVAFKTKCNVASYLSATKQNSFVTVSRSTKIITKEYTTDDRLTLVP